MVHFEGMGGFSEKLLVLNQSLIPLSSMQKQSYVREHQFANFLIGHCRFSEKIFPQVNGLFILYQPTGFAVLFGETTAVEPQSQLDARREILSASLKNYLVWRHRVAEKWREWDNNSSPLTFGITPK
jgi:hypothetical protein